MPRALVQTMLAEAYLADGKVHQASKVVVAALEVLDQPVHTSHEILRRLVRKEWRLVNDQRPEHDRRDHRVELPPRNRDGGALHGGARGKGFGPRIATSDAAIFFFTIVSLFFTPLSLTHLT